MRVFLRMVCMANTPHPLIRDFRRSISGGFGKYPYGRSSVDVTARRDRPFNPASSRECA